MKNGEMLVALGLAMRNLPDLLKNPKIWKSLYIDYEPPIVERVYTDMANGLRLSLHVIHPCEEGAALFHPHPWPSAVYIWRGKYLMNMGYGFGLEPPPVAITSVMTAGSSYEMIHPDAWHSVQPLENVSYSVMISSQPWDRQMPITPKRQLSPLSDNRMEAIISDFYGDWNRTVDHLD